MKQALDGSLAQKNDCSEGGGATQNLTAPAGANAPPTPQSSLNASSSNSSEANSTNSDSDKKNQTEAVPSNSTKMTDQQVAQVIDEVSLEQEANESVGGEPEAAPKPTQNKDDEFQGFIGKYTKKLVEKDQPEESQQEIPQ